MAFTYISDAGKKNLHKYKYNGCDESFTYKYFLSPIARYLVGYVPMWVA